MESALWDAVFKKLKIADHNFSTSGFSITSGQIKGAIGNSLARRVGEKLQKLRVLDGQRVRGARPQCFKERNLFMLPVGRGEYVILEGDGYIDIPPYAGKPQEYKSKLEFDLKSSSIGNSEMQHLDKAYATSVLRTFMDDPSLVLTIRGRKYTPKFEFRAGEHKHKVEVDGVQTEVDGGYEGKDQIVLVEAKNRQATDTIIRQLYYPMRQWSVCGKPVKLVFFESSSDKMILREYSFKDQNDYHSIQLGRLASYRFA